MSVGAGIGAFWCCTGHFEGCVGNGGMGCAYHPHVACDCLAALLQGQILMVWEVCDISLGR